MVFRRLGELTSRHWLVVLLAWTAVAATVHYLAPAWDDVTQDGDLAYLPATMTSVRGERLLQRAFPDSKGKSQIALIVERPDGPLRAADLEIADSLASRFAPDAAHGLPVVGVWTRHHLLVGRKLVSSPRLAERQGQATLVVVTLSNEFMATDNIRVLEHVNRVLDEFRRQSSFPPGLRLGVSGSAAIGGDMLSSAKESIENTELATIVIIVAFLLVVYRAPLLIVVPLATIGVSLVVATDLIASLTQASWLDFKVFKTTKIFIVVLLFGAGTDFCLFLIARLKEELAAGREYGAAVSRALDRVGAAVTASACTTIVGLAMMYFAEFGKFRNSGPAIALAIAVTLAACITLAPALLRAGGKFVFWPFAAPGAAPPSTARRAPSAPSNHIAFGRFWEWASHLIVARPGLVMVVTILLLAPLAYTGLSVDVTYDLLGELRADRPSVQGTAMLRRHFAPGDVGPLTIVARLDGAQFDAAVGEQNIAALTKHLNEIEGISSVRSFTEPLGERPFVNPFRVRKTIARRHALARTVYVSQAEGLSGDITRFDLVLAHDPFSPQSIEVLDRIDRSLTQASHDRNNPWHRAEFDFVGTTAGTRDLRAVTERDRLRIQLLVTLAVLGVLLVVVRRPLVCAYLIASVLFSYFVTIGAAEWIFAWAYGGTYHGLDWKVPIFLFVILVAVGEDYNIYLVTRVFEEQPAHGLIEGLRRAIVYTGGIITSCGIIMASTFLSMMTGTLRGMLELGFALAAGVALDTFVVRPVLVPAFLAIVYRRRQTVVQTVVETKAGDEEWQVTAPHAASARRLGGAHEHVSTR